VRPSFYVTPEIDVALEWADKKAGMWRDECAILIYAVPEGNSLFHRTFSEPDAEWKRLTRSSRMCDDDINELDACDIVQGPMVLNVYAVLHKGAAPKPHRPPKMQLASKSDAADALLGRSLVAVLWLEKNA
jgi:hypothetical protein